MKIQRREIYVACMVAMVAAMAFVFTLQGVSVGDDMGYCFADSRLHNGNGQRIEEFSQILDTQASHFLHFNGRVIVHSLTQLLLLDESRLIFSLLNSLAYSFLCLMICRLITGGKITSLSLTATLAMLWWLMPAPGVIWFSLVAFALNYLWPAAICALLLWGLLRLLNGEMVHIFPWLLVGLLCGALQESFSLPLLGSVAIFWLFFRKRLPKQVRKRLLLMGVALFLGLLSLLLAPGNYAHLDTGGGLGIQVIGHKTLSMLRDSLRTPLPWLIAGYALLLPRKSTRSLAHPDSFELLLLLAIGCALMLGVVSFTAVRQLVAPSIFSIILIGRIMRSLLAPASRNAKLMLGWVAAVSVGYLWVGGYFIREQAEERFEQVKKAVSRGELYIFVDCSGASYNAPFDRILEEKADADPFADDLLHLVFDSNTRKGLRRLHNPASIPSRVPQIIPVSKEKLLNSARQLPLIQAPGNYKSLPLDSRYSLIKLRRTKRLPDLRYSSGEHMNFATYCAGDTMLLILPGNAQEVRIAKLSLQD